MTTLTARGVLTGAAMLQLIADHAGMTERDFATGAYLEQLDPALDITARDIVTGAYVHKLNTAAEPAPAGLLLIPNGAIESVDGEYQRFVYDGIRTTEFLVIWHAELPSNARLREYQITLKVPQFNEFSTLGLFIIDAENPVITGDPGALNHVSLDFNGTDLTRVALNPANDPDNLIRPTLNPQPVTDSIVTLTLTNDMLTYTWSGGSNSIAMPSGFFTNPPNVMVYSAGADVSGLVDLSIKIGDAA